MMFTIILFMIGFALFFIAFEIGTNAAMKTKQYVPLYIIQFSLFMAVANFCFYYLGIWASKLFFNLITIRYIITALIMYLLCAKTIINVRHYKVQDNFYDLSLFPIRIMLSVAAGINSFLAGIALTIGGFEHLKTAMLTSTMVFIGTLLGARFKKNTAQKIIKLRPSLIGSLLFLAIAIIYTLKHFGKISFY